MSHGAPADGTAAVDDAVVPTTAPPRSARSGPLAGVAVIELAGMGPGPFAAMLLADLGADVVRIERPPTVARRALNETDALDSVHDVIQRGRRALAIDLKSPGGLRAVLDLCRGADVLLEGFRPGVAERLGLGPLDVQRVNPRLIYARLTGWGQTGPLSQTVGHDINYVALSGVLSLLGHPGERPRPPMNLLGDYAGGGLVAALGIVSALFETARSGQGQVIDAAMLDGAALVNAKTHSLRTLPSWSDQPGTNFIDGGAPFYDTYETRDGKYVAVGAIEPDFFRAFLSGLGVDTSSWPEQNDRQSWPKLRRLIADVVITRTRDDWAQRYEHSDGCLTPVLTLDEAAAHPHIVDRATYVRRQGVLQPAPAPRFSRTPTAIADGEPA